MSEAPQPWPAQFAWLPADTPSYQIAICERAGADLGVCEMPPSSNRGGRIDAFNTRAGAPLGSYWCMSAATAWWVDAGCDVPPVPRGACEDVMRWAIAQGLWHATPVIGAMAIYGSPDGNGGWLRDADGRTAHHVGLVVRLTPYTLSIEGNASWAGFSTNGEAVCLRRCNTARVIGYAHPRPRTP